MTIRGFLKYGAFGFLVQVLLATVAYALGFGELALGCYIPWIEFINFVLPVAGHAMIGPGAIVGFLAAMFVYSCVLGILLFNIQQVLASALYNRGALRRQ